MNDSRDRYVSAPTAKITIHNLSPKSQNAISDVVKRRITWTGPQLLELALAGASTAPAELVSTNAGIAAVNLEVSEGTNSWLWFVGNSSKISAEGQSLTLECADFVDQVGAAHVLPPRSFAKGTPVLDVVEAHINAMGLSVERPILEREFYAQYAKLGKVKTGRSCINFKKLEDLNLAATMALVKEGAKFGGINAVKAET